jgi:hypothetical protein
VAEAAYGLEACIKAIGKAKADVGKTIAESLEKCGQVVLKKAKYYVPKDTRALELSGQVVVTGKGLGTKVLVTFGTDYAVPVHERLDLKHAEPTCAKYLERAVRETRGTCASIVRRDLQAGVNITKGG